MFAWKPIEQAPRGTGSLLLRDGAGTLDPVYVGAQADDGRWYFGNQEARPLYFALIPAFDCEE